MQFLNDLLCLKEIIHVRASIGTYVNCFTKQEIRYSVTMILLVVANHSVNQSYHSIMYSVNYLVAHHIYTIYFHPYLFAYYKLIVYWT